MFAFPTPDGHSTVRVCMPVTYLDLVLQDGGTPLFWASFKGHKETVMFLLEQRADVNAQDKVYIQLLRLLYLPSQLALGSSW